MAKVVVNLATGLEDPERVMAAFLIAGSALDNGRECVIFATKDAVRLAVPGHAVGSACEGCPPLDRLFQQFADGGGRMLLCPFCFNSRNLDENDIVDNAQIGGATPLWQWVGDETPAVFSF